MNNAGKLALAIGAVVVLASAGVFLIMNQGGDNSGGESGIDVSNTPCDGIGAARTAVDNEYNASVEAANKDYKEAMEAASDTYWENYRDYETEKNACETNALMADPCVEHFERASALAKEILDNIDSGYDEAKSAERDQAKEDWEKCKKDPPEEDTYEGKMAKCAAEFASAVALAKDLRNQTEANALSALSDALDKADEAKASKHATLDAIAEICNIPPPKTEMTAGGITTGSTGTVVESGNPACSGNFTGHDPDIQQEIDRLQNLLAQAQTGGKTEGLGGTNQLSAKITQLRADMTTGPRKCTSDSDCGDTTKVCCSETQVGWVVCSGGGCGTETEDCDEDETCSGKPAECVSGAEGAESAGIEISRTFIKGATCNPSLQMINLRPKDENSARYEIVGNVPEWLNFDKVGGALPQDVLVSINCDITKTEGTYTGEASITIYDKDDNLINTIPINVTIEVVPSILEDDDLTETTGGDIDLIDPEEEATTNDPEEVIIEDDEPEKQVSVGPGTINFTYDHANPTCPLPITPLNIDGPSGATYEINVNFPTWLYIPGSKSGQLPTTVEMQFPCRLDKYENQNQSFTIPVIVTTPDGEKKTYTADVNGTFKNF
ncbi:hypothetical protein KAJ89_02880 [Candidatus Parcubacteria bacterium]|nr:hypothetical protein [Candidatus Parcubacteria bacterium]